ncbi:alpha-L-rhamnosidase [Blautia marasmi]|uniref:alpha-L-rhamnosidase n=1 Tax=Blautia marasmi TaxID=1917868 RepID=UPI00266CF385|nr:alpha-L-rhamnosidase [Blautia marasmi]
MKIKNCKTNHMINPLGYYIDVPVFSWQIEEATGKFQTKARILVARDERLEELCADTGMKENLNNLAAQVKMELSPRTRYYWKVMVQTDAGEETSGDVSWFETGKMGESWQGKWITCEENQRHPIFEKRITVKKKVLSARLYICGLGVYEVSVNGKKVSDEYLTPYCNNYEEWLQYQTYDVTKQLESGGVLQVMLGNGWCLGRFGFFSKPGDSSVFHKKMEMIAELRIVYEDGSEEVIGSDESWKVRRSTLTFSNIYDGEHRDDTLEDVEREMAIPAKETAALTERYSLPVKVQEEIKPVELIHTSAGELVLDIGQNISGIFCLHVNEPAGTIIHLQFGEVLQNGNFYRDNLRSALAEYIYVSDGKEKVIEPHFTFYGYRYVKIEGIPELKADDFTALAVYSSLTECGRIQTGHQKVNQLISNASWGLKGNFLDVPTDCPQRDERMGWTGDAQVFSPTACFMRDSYAFYRKYLHDMATEQKNLGGKVPDVVPSFHYHSTSSVWGDACCIIPWNMYLFYGDLTILKEQFESMKSWVDYIQEVDGEDHGWREVFHYGDWLALDNPSGGSDQCMGGTEEGYIADIYYANSAEIVSKAARLLGNETAAIQYNALSQRIREEVRAEYFSTNGRCCIDTQTALLLALYFNIAPDEEKTKKMLRKKFLETKGKLQTGFVGTPILCNQLTKEGMEHQAYDLLLNEEYPGWLYAVNLGATTIWERWNSLNEDGTVSSTGMNSFNHYSYGSIVEWMFRHVAGLNPVEETPGFQKVEIKPVPDIRIGYMNMEYESAAGCYKIYWKAEDESHLSLRLTIPFGCQAELTLPYAPKDIYFTENPIFRQVENGICYLHAGSYEITYETVLPMRKVYSIDDDIKELLIKEPVKTVLEKYLPGIGTIPDFMKKMSLSEIVMEKNQDPCILEKLNEELKNLTV